MKKLFELIESTKWDAVEAGDYPVADVLEQILMELEDLELYREAEDWRG